MSTHEYGTLSNRIGRFAQDTRNIGLLALLAVQIALVVFVYWPSATTVADSSRLLEVESTDAVTGLKIADASGNQISLTRGPDGWILEQTDGYPANATKIESTLEKLLAINRLRLVTETEASHRRLQVAEDTFASRVTLNTTDGDVLLYIGSSAGPGSTHVRLAGESRTYLTSDIDTWEISTQASSWIDTTYVSVDTESIATLTVENANGTLTLIKDGEGNWTMADIGPEETADSASIESFISRVSTVTIQRPLGTQIEPAYGLNPPVATTTIVYQDESGTETTSMLEIGNPLENQAGFYAKSAESPYFVTIGAAPGDAIVNAARDEFVTEVAADEDASGGVSSEDAVLPEETQIEPSEPITP